MIPISTGGTQHGLQQNGRHGLAIGPSGPVNHQHEKLNVGFLERALSVGGGGMLTAFGLTRKSIPGLALACLGGALVYRGMTGHCCMYQMLGLNTASRPEGPMASVRAGHGVRIDESITIGCPPDQLFAIWSDFQNLPQIMRHLKRVDVINARRSHWIARAPLGLSVEWDAVIHTERENELISWRSLPGSDIDTAGSVHFRQIPGGAGTILRVELKYNPLGGKLGGIIAGLLGESPEQQIREDLCRFKDQVECRDGQCASIGSTRGGSLEHRRTRKDMVHESSDESFPASDPPSSW